MLIDLHCHTKSVKSGENKARNVSAEVFKNKVEAADIKIIAITNHNCFDFKQYNELKEVVKDLCQVWPGIEIDVKGKREQAKYHLLVISNPNSVEAFDTQVKKLFADDDVNSTMHSAREICETFSTIDAIYIPHFHNKKPAISEEDRNDLMEFVGDSARVFIEPRDHRTLGVLANNAFNVMIGSDVQDWSVYEQSSFAELRLPVSNFSEFVLLARKDTGVVNTLMQNKTPMKLIGKPHETVELLLNIYPDINILFGAKGTGKTEILLSLYNNMIKDGRNCKKYIASERSEDFSNLLSIADLEIDLTKVGADSCEEEFSLIEKWTDCVPADFSGYISWVKTRNNSNNKARMKITEAVHENLGVIPKYEEHKNDKFTIENIMDSIGKISMSEYLADNDIEILMDKLSLIKSIVWKKRKDDIVEEEAVALTNKSIDLIKKYADRNSNTVSHPSTVGFTDFVVCRVKLLGAVKKIIKMLEKPEHNDMVKIGDLEGKGKIFVNNKYRMLCNESKTAEFKQHGINILKETKSLLYEIQGKAFDEDVAVLVDKFNGLCNDNNIHSVKAFLGLSKQIVTNDGEKYEPSNGEKGIILLQQMLTDDADAYFLDEPELGMGNSYIDTNIRPILSDLAKQRKVVVVATHNANIAVRTLPYMSIFRVHEDSEYKTYMGNPFDDKLVNINDSQDIRSWIEESLHTLEGSREAFYERRDIYESNRD